MNTAQYVNSGLAFLAIVTSLWNTRKIWEVHVMVNSRLTELLKVSIREAHTEGVADERQRQKGPAA